MPFVIGVSNGDFSQDYYGGSTYVHQGETFPSLVKRSEAKRYKSKNGVEKAVESLNRKCEGLFFIIEVPE
jgi:hypothetical protein